VQEPRPVTLAGRHVRLEPLEREHLDDLAACCEPAFYQWMPAGPYGPGGFAAWLGRAHDARDAGRELPFALVLNETGQAIGTTRFGDISPRDERLEIGWTWIGHAHQRTVANTEMKRLLLGHAFDELGAGRVTLKTGAANEASRRAITRLGAVEEGVLRRHVLLDDGSFRDTVYYSIVAEEWPAVRDRLIERLMR
jgi:RimJ/RimL family protein N-acetyltransferase